VLHLLPDGMGITAAASWRSAPAAVHHM